MMRLEILDEGFRILTPAKVNLHLEVGPPRTDGFHDIDSLFQTVTLFDELELQRQEDVLTLDDGALALGADNLVLRAAEKLRSWAQRQGARRLGARLRLQKRIPAGAGLGGGSSDAAAALLGLCRLWDLDPSRNVLSSLAAEIGSDVPFFLRGATARCRGRGEQVTPIRFAAGEAPLFFVLAYPRLSISTARVYRDLDAAAAWGRSLTHSSVLDSISATSLRSHLGCDKLFFNRLEKVVFSAFPAVHALHVRMAKEPFSAVLLSGSGSTVFGVCGSAEHAHEIAQRLVADVEADIFSVRSELAPQSVYLPADDD